MIFRPEFSGKTRPPAVIPHFRKGRILQEDWTEQSGELNGSASQLHAFVRELIEMTGRRDAAPDVLELQFGDVLTRTSVQEAERSWLMVMAYLPKCRGSQFAPSESVALSAPASGNLEIFWHADEGRYVGIRRIPVTDLPSERSVMDAVLATAEDAAAWFSSRRLGKASIG